MGQRLPPIVAQPWTALRRRFGTITSRLGGLALGLLVGLTGILGLSLYPVADLEESAGLDWLFNLRGPVDPPDDVVIVAIDAQSARQFGLADRPRDWPRNLHAELVAYLANAGARIICFDLTFDTPSAVAPNDLELAAAMGRARNVLVTDSLRKETIWLQGSDGKAVGRVLIEKPAPPIAMIEQAALAHAPFLLPKSSRVNAYWTFRSGDEDSPTLPILAFHSFASSAVEDLVALLHEVEPTRPLRAPRIDPLVSTSEKGIDNFREVRAAVVAAPDIRGRVLRRLQERRDISPERRRAVESLLKLYSSREMSYLNFYGPARSVKTVSYSEVLNAGRSASPSDSAQRQAGLFKNKAVFVGFSASDADEDRVRDDYRTVYSQANGHDISGVEIQATAFANALEGRPLSPAPQAWQFAILGAWGLLLGVVCRLVRPVRALATVAALAAVFLWCVYRQFAGEAVWWPSIIPIGVQVPMALFAGVWLNYRDTRREREAVKRAFGQFLPGSVVEQLARNVGPITARNRVVYGACLATDADKYTTLAEQTEPGKLGELMNEYYADLFVPIEHTGGVVIDVVGDAMVAIWAGALSDAELRISACNSALEIVEVLDRASAEGRSVLPTRLGLHAGEMLIGSFGASRHYEYRAVGDIVNTASRIQGLNKTLGTRLLASQATFDGLDQFRTRPLGSFLLAGKLTAVSIVELLGRKDAVDDRLGKLCESFGRALDAYRVGRLREAIDGFEQVLRSEPADGPARFYLERCERLVSSNLAGEWTPTIRIDAK